MSVTRSGQSWTVEDTGTLAFHRPLSEQLLIAALLGGGLVAVGSEVINGSELSFIGVTFPGSVGRVLVGGVGAFLLVAAVLVVGRFVVRVPSLELDGQGFTARFGMRAQQAAWGDVAVVGAPVVVKRAGVRPRFLDVELRNGGRVRVPIILNGISPEEVRGLIRRRADGA